MRLIVIPLLAIAAMVGALSFGGYYARLGALLACFVLVVDLASLAKGWVQNVLVTCAALLFGFGAIEAVALTLVPHDRFMQAKDLKGARPEIGWGPSRPGRFPVERIQNGKRVYKVIYTIDPNLLRHVDSNPDGPTVAFFGDSFTYGDGVNDNETIPQHFADLAPQLHVVNLAFSAYSPAQMLRELQLGLFDDVLKDPRLFLIYTGPLHVERVACKPYFSLRAPRYVTVGGKLGGEVEYKGPCTSGLWRKVREAVAETAIEKVFVSPITRRLTHEDVVDYLNVMRAIAKISRDKYHVPLAVIYFPSWSVSLGGTGFTDATIKKDLEAAGIHLITYNFDESKPIRIPIDGHYTSLGNKIIAEAAFHDLETTMPDVLRPKETSEPAKK